MSAREIEDLFSGATIDWEEDDSQTYLDSTVIDGKRRYTETGSYPGYWRV